MRKIIIYGTVTYFLFSLTIFAFKSSIAQEEVKEPLKEAELPVVKESSQVLMATYQGPTVTISGKVAFPDYKEGQQIRISAKSFPGEGRADITYVDILEPGEYSLKVPQNIGDVYIGTVVLQPGETDPRRGSSRGEYNSNPLKLNYSNIEGIDIIIEGSPSLLMATYQGPTVTISGKVAFPDYKEGQQIRISAKSFPGEGRADITYVDILEPGEYSLKVPQNIGDVYISAVVIELGQKGPTKDSLRRKYNGNPIKVETTDILEVNITLP